ncbi:RluA family pseudouridine synthase [Candidatus Falkowbacteria bacterium]|nr:RluA family pseudouridine synthase [Candidatus Falkowbacteria bacterium]
MASNMNTDFPEIIFEDNNYLVINKPAGLIVHGGPGIKGVTLVDLLLDKYPFLKEVGDEALRPGIVHRLDKDVSGLMVIAKTTESFSSLKEQFKERDVNKTYLALAHGKIEKDYDDINFPIKRAKDGYKMAALPLNTVDLLIKKSPQSRDRGNIEGFFKAREASTSFKVLKRFINYTFLEVTIKTGRTHQIRVHFFAYGHPLVGDNLYFNKKSREKNKKFNLNRVFLVASQLSFMNLKGERKEFSLPLPSELEKLLPKN